MFFYQLVPNGILPQPEPSSQFTSPSDLGLIRTLQTLPASAREQYEANNIKKALDLIFEVY
jgi:hypothetical protein